MEIQRAKGTRDFLPEDKILRDNIINTIKEVFELYGYNPLETPVLERFDILSSKYTGGAEILKETFKLKDQGGRDLALRYDLTVPLARVIGMNPNLKMPFKRYQIADVFRDGPIKAGRYRVFMQCDVDIVGCKDVRADAEMLNIAKDVFNRLKLDIIIKVNNRKILDTVMDYAGIEKEKRDMTILSIDKLEKLGLKYVEDELKNNGLKKKQIKDLINIITIKGSNNEKVEKLKKLLKNQEWVKEIEELLKYSDAEFDVSLARGLSYYTGNIFEVYLRNSEIKSSVAAGGRYDKMIGSLIGRGEYPAVGISFGLDVITDAIKLDKKLEFKKSIAKVYVIPIKTFDKCIKMIQSLRVNGINVDIDLMDRGISKNLDYADKLGIPFVLIIGEDELKKNKLKLRDMKSGKEEMLNIDGIIKKLR
ncbi:MAG: histidine--tRNA ligase [Nanoarchaeota archaeon]